MGRANVKYGHVFIRPLGLVKFPAQIEGCESPLDSQTRSALIFERRAINRTTLQGKEANISAAKFSDDFKRDAVLQMVERGNPIAEVSKRLSVSPHSLYAWRKRFAKSHSPDGSLDKQAAEIRRLKLELAHVTQERDILKRQRRTSPGIHWCTLSPALTYI